MSKNMLIYKLTKQIKLQQKIFQEKNKKKSINLENNNIKTKLNRNYIYLKELYYHFKYL